MQYQAGYSESMYTFVNNINTVEGGMHLTGFRNALTRTINDYARSNNLLKPNEENLSGDDVREGLTCVISVKVPNPQFEGQTKTKLGNQDVKGIVDTIVSTDSVPIWKNIGGSQRNYFQIHYGQSREKRHAGKRTDTP